MKRSRYLGFLAIALLVGLAFFPWIVGNLFAPLRPPVFEETATVYSITESAYFTREAALELSATSQQMTLPPEDLEPMPGDPDYTPPASWTPVSSSGLSNTRLVQIRSTPVTITGISTHPLERYSCPSPSAHISGQFPPNQRFTILGWNVDFDNITYLLIGNDPTLQQVWLQIPDLTIIQLSDNYLETPAIACRTYIVSATPSSGQATLTAVAMTNSMVSTATISPPRIASATPPPPVPARLVITEQDAIQQIRESVPELHDPQIEFTPEDTEIRGYIDLPGPLGTTIRGDVVIHAILIQENVDIRAVIQSINVAGRNITDTSDVQQVENAINNWLSALLVRRDVQSFELLNELLIIDVLERQFSVYDEETWIATVIPYEQAATATLTASPEFRSMTPLSIWTETPFLTGLITPSQGE